MEPRADSARVLSSGDFTSTLKLTPVGSSGKHYQNEDRPTGNLVSHLIAI